MRDHSAFAMFCCVVAATVQQYDKTQNVTGVFYLIFIVKRPFLKLLFIVYLVLTLKRQDHLHKDNSKGNEFWYLLFKVQTLLFIVKIF